MKKRFWSCFLGFCMLISLLAAGCGKADSVTVEDLVEANKDLDFTKPDTVPGKILTTG